MKLFTEARQTGNTERMIRHSRRMISEAIRNWDALKVDWKVLIVTPNYDGGMKLRHEFIEHLTSSGIRIPEYSDADKVITFQLRNGMNVTTSIEIPSKVTLDDLKKYDCVIVDDVFKHICRINKIY